MFIFMLKIVETKCISLKGTEAETHHHRTANVQTKLLL